MNIRKRQFGLTLLELMTVLVIVAILGAISYPLYTDQVRKARRQEGKSFLLQVAAAQEKFFTNNNAYTTALTTAVPNGLGFGSNLSNDGNYQITIALTGGGSGYTMTIAPQGDQAADTECGSFTLDSTGNQTISGSGEIFRCW